MERIIKCASDGSIVYCETIYEDGRKVVDFDYTKD